MGLLRINFILDGWVDMRQYELHLPHAGVQLTQYVCARLSALQRQDDKKRRIDVLKTETFAISF